MDSFVAVKRFARACYAIDQQGHFGLGLTEYLHFTSPMRRYADVIVHRLLAGWQISREDLDAEVDWINWRAEFNKALQRQYTAWKVAAYLREHAVSELDVWVTGVSAAGLLWFAPAYSLSGFSHVSLLEPAQRWKLEGVGLEAALVGGDSRFEQMHRYKACIHHICRHSGAVTVRIVA